MVDKDIEDDFLGGFAGCAALSGYQLRVDHVTGGSGIAASTRASGVTARGRRYGIGLADGCNGGGDPGGTGGKQNWINVTFVRGKLNRQ